MKREDIAETKALLALEARIAALERRLGQSEPEPGTDETMGLEKRLRSLDAEVGRIEEAAGIGNADPNFANLCEQVEKTSYPVRAESLKAKEAIVLASVERIRSTCKEHDMTRFEAHGTKHLLTVTETYKTVLR